MSKGNNRSGLVDAAGRAIIKEDEIGTTIIGGRELKYFLDPTKAQRPPADVGAVAAHVGILDMINHALMREIIALRARIEELEAASNETCDEQPEILS